MSDSLSWLRQLMPPAVTVGRVEQLRAAMGALAALMLAGLLSSLVLGSTNVWLIAPMGASSVLLFCLPASPLAQPWSVIGGNTVSALAGVSVAQFGLEPMLAAPLAGALAIGAMFLMRCLHPPGGAVALTAVLAGPAVEALGVGFALAPVALNSSLMVVGALVYNNLTGRRYPHVQQSPMQNTHATVDSAPTARIGFRSADLDVVLERYGQVLDVSRDDLENIILATETQAYTRRFGVITCGAIMSTDVITTEFATELDQAWRLMRNHKLRALPVLNRARRVIGMVSQGDFLRHSDLDDAPTVSARVQKLLRRSRTTHSEKPEVVGQIMTRPVISARASTPIVDLVPLMANSGLHHIPVLDEDDRFAGMVTQSDLVAALYQSGLSELAVA